MCESVRRKLGHTTVANPSFFYLGGSMRKSDQQHHSTFFVQSLFFLLVFVENMLLASWPLIKGRASERMSGEKLAVFTSNLANTSHIFCSRF